MKLRIAISPSFLALTFLLFSLTCVRANVSPAGIFLDHMVLQAGRPLPIWGTASPGEKIQVSFADQKITTTTSPEGTWKITLAPLKVNKEPAELTFQGTNTLVFKDVLVGEVWLCSGQSNMEFTLDKAKDAAAEIAAADDPLLRQFSVRYSLANEPQTKIDGYWSVCTPASAPSFSAVGYFFARELRQKLGVPIAIINSSWGGTDIEAWMPPASLAANPDFAFVAADWLKLLEKAPALKAEYDAALAEDERKATEAKARGETFKKPWHQTPPVSDGSPDMRKPSAIYNAKIHPLAPFSLAGILWYQGEGGYGPNYRKLFPALITGWRTLFAQGDLQFYWVQLPNYNFGNNWPAMREAQASTLALPATAQAVAIDIGEVEDIHPLNKQDVGHRLALIALQKKYSQKLVSSGPVFAKARFVGSSATVTFTELGGGLIVKGGALKSFELAGSDKIFKPAEASLKGDTVIVRSAEVPHPVAVRYAWSNAPVATLFNKADLPAAPFRSDDW